MQLLTARATFEAKTRLTPTRWNSGAPPAESAAPPATGTRVSHTRGRSRLPRITTPAAAVNAGVDAASACSRLTSTYLKLATANATDSARVWDRTNTFQTSRPLFRGLRSLQPALALNSHHANDTSMCVKVRNTGRRN